MPRYPRVSTGTLLLVVLTISLALFTSPLMAAGKSDVAKKLDVQKNLANMPLVFAPNMGQATSDVRYMSHGAGYGIALTDDGTRLALPKAGELRLKFEGAATAKITSADPQKTKFNYFLGNDRSRWKTNVPSYGRVNYTGLYAGVDAAFYGTNGRLEHDFIVAPGADPSQIRIGIEGSKKIKIDRDGNLMLATSDQPVEMLKAVAYQMVDGQRKLVHADYVVAKNHVTFRLGAYDKSRELVIDPVVLYGTMVGGTASSTVQAISYNTVGNLLYIAGQTGSATLGAWSIGSANAYGGLTGTNLFFAQMDDANNAVSYQWVTFVGGSGTDSITHAKYVGGKMWAAGNTTSLINFPVSATAYQVSGSVIGSAQAGIFLSVDSSGSLAYSSYLGTTNGGAATSVNGIDVDTNTGKVYIGGQSNDLSLAVTNGNSAIAAPAGGNAWGFIAEIDPTVAGTLVSGTWVEAGIPAASSSVVDIALDSTPKVHAAVFDDTNAVNGYGSWSANQGVSLMYWDLSQTGAAQFVSASTFGTAGAGGETTATSLHYDFNVREYIVGNTTSPDTAAPETLGAGGQNGYVAQFVNGTFNAAHLITTAPGAGDSALNEDALSVDTDGNGAVYVGGYTNANDMAVVGDGTGSSLGGDPQAGFISVYNSSFGLVFQRYVNKGSGASNSSVNSVSVGSPANANEFVGFFGGRSDANHLASTSTAVQPDNTTGGTQGFVFKAALNPTAAAFGASTAIGGGTITYGIDGSTVYNASGVVVSNFSVPITLQGDATNPLDYVTIDTNNYADGFAPTVPLGLLTGGAGCYNGTANTPGGVTCHVGTIATGTTITPNLTFTPAAASECDESHSPQGAGALPCGTYSFSIFPNVSAAQNGAFVNGGQQNFTVEPVTNISIGVTPPASPIAAGASVAYTVLVSNVGNHAAENTVTVDLLSLVDPGFVVTNVGPPVAGGTGAAPILANCLSQGSCTFSDLQKGTTETITVTGSYSSAYTGTNPTKVSNSTWSVSGAGFIETSQTDNTSATSPTVQRNASMTIATGAFPAGPMALGATGQTYNWTVANAVATNSLTANASVSIAYPAGFAVTNATNAGWTCPVTASPIVCTTTTGIAPGASSSIAIVGTWTDSPTAAIGGQSLTATLSLTDAVNMAAPTPQTETTTLQRVINAGVVANTYPTGPTTLGAATSYGTDVAVTVTAGTYNQIPANGLTLTLTVPTNFTPTGAIPPPAGWNCVALVCTNTVAITSTGTVNFPVAGSYNDDPTNAPAAVQGGQFKGVVTFGGSVTSNAAATTTVTAATTLNRIVTLNVSAPAGSAVQLGAATTLTTTLTATGNQVPKNYAQITFVPDAGFTVVNVTSSDAANWVCAGNGCTNNNGAGTVTSGVVFTLHGSYNDDPTRNLGPQATTGANVTPTATATGDATFSDSGSTATVNGSYTLNRVLSATMAATPSYPTGPITLGGVTNTTYGTTVTVTVTPGVDNQVPQGALTFTLNVPTNLNPGTPSGVPAPFTCTGGPVYTCSNTLGPITSSGTFLINSIGTWNDDPTNLTTPVVQPSQFSSTENAVNLGPYPNTTIASVTPAITAATTLQRLVDVSFTSATITDSSGGTTTLLNPITYTASIVSGATSNIAPINGLALTFTLPADFNITSVVPSGADGAAFTCNFSNPGHVATCANSVATVAAGGAATFTIAGNYIDNPTDPLTAGTINGSIAISGAIANNTTAGPKTDSATTNLQREVSWSYGAMTAPATAVLGSQVSPAGAVTYSITLTSAAASATSNTAPINNTTMTFAPPANFTATGATITGGTAAAAFTCSPSGSNYVCVNTAGPFPPASTVTMQLAGNFIDTAADPLALATFTASAAKGANITTLTGYAPVNGTTTPKRDVTLAISGVASTTTPVIAAPMTYTYTVANSGPDATASPALDAALIPIQFTFPANFAISSTTNAGWACNTAGQVVTCNPSGTNSIASGSNSTIVIGGSYTDAATFATATTPQTVTATEGAPTATACSGAPCETELGSGTIAPVTVNVQRDVTLATAITQKDPVTNSTTQVGATDNYTYSVIFTNSGANDATAPTIVGTTTLTVTVDPNFTVSGYTYSPVNPADTAACVVNNATHTVTCTFNNLKSTSNGGSAETVVLSGTYASVMVNNTSGSGTGNISASATDSLANVAGSSASSASTLVMDTHLSATAEVPFFPFTNLTPTYASVTTSGITTDAAGAAPSYSFTETYAVAPLSTAFPSGTPRQYTAHSNHQFAITNGVAGAKPDLCGVNTGFVKAERARIFSGTSGTDLTNTTVTAGSCAFAPASGTATSGQVHGTLNDWTSGSAYASDLSLVEPTNRNPVVLTQTQATTAGAVLVSGNSVTFNVNAIFADPDINQPCYGAAAAGAAINQADETGTCNDVISVTISGSGATAAGPFSSSGSSQTQNGYSGNPQGRAASTMSFAIPPNSTVTFTLTATDQTGASSSQSYSITAGGTTQTPPPLFQTVNPGGTAVFGYLAGSATTCTLDTNPADYTAFNLANGTNYVFPTNVSGSTTLANLFINCTLNGSTVVVVTSGTVTSATHPLPLPAQPAGNNAAMLAALTAMTGLPVFGILLFGSKNKKLVKLALITWLALVLILMMVGCGGGGFQGSPSQHIGSGTTPTGAYLITTTGSGSPATQNFMVVVQ